MVYVREAFVCRAIHRSHDLYFIWVSESDPKLRDAVLLDVDRTVPSFSSEGAAREFASARIPTVSEDSSATYDFDRLAEWCSTARAADLDVRAALNAWNLFTDLEFKSEEATNLFDHIQGSANALYDKLFWANNLPSVTPEGKTFIPEWDGRELARLSSILSVGLQEFLSRLRLAT